jgi:predicted GNAT family N-acyltransferase
MRSGEGFAVGVGDWAWASPGAVLVRRRVFIEEQGVPENLEWDAEDAASLHAVASDGEGRPVGTARLLTDGHIGRVAVLPSWRRAGVGSSLVRRLVAEARGQGHVVVHLNAQVAVLRFYARLGFLAHGPVFDDAGIPHRAMSLGLRA